MIAILLLVVLTVSSCNCAGTITVSNVIFVYNRVTTLDNIRVVTTIGTVSTPYAATRVANSNTALLGCTDFLPTSTLSGIQRTLNGNSCTYTYSGTLSSSLLQAVLYVTASSDGTSLSVEYEDPSTPNSSSFLSLNVVGSSRCV